MSNTLRVRAAAKINLVLDVVGKRPDGYHNLSTVMQQIPLYDEITLTFGGDQGVRTSTNLDFIHSDKNIAGVAAVAFYDLIGENKYGLDISISKRIPVGAGLGGGSADAAAVLRALNEYHKRPLDEAHLLKLGAGIGADVPFCLVGGCALCEGIGDLITPIPGLMTCFLLVVKPQLSISTARLFSELGPLEDRRGPDVEGTVKSLVSGDLRGVANRVGNILEEHASEVCPDISIIKNTMIGMGALGSSMSGSGSAVFGIFDTPASASLAYDHFKSLYKAAFLLKM